MEVGGRVRLRWGLAEGGDTFLSEGSQPRFEVVSVWSKMMPCVVLHFSLSGSEVGL